MTVAEAIQAAQCLRDKYARSYSLALWNYQRAERRLEIARRNFEASSEPSTEPVDPLTITRPAPMPSGGTQDDSQSPF